MKYEASRGGFTDPHVERLALRVSAVLNIKFSDTEKVNYYDSAWNNRGRQRLRFQRGTRRGTRHQKDVMIQDQSPAGVVIVLNM